MVEYSPYAYETHEDPYPIYAKLRAEAPVYRNDELDFWALALHEDVLAVLKDARTFSNREGVSIDRLASHGAEAVMSFLAMDPPKHTHMRALVSRGFTPRRAAELEPRIRELAERYLDQCEGRDEFDLIGDYAARLPMDVVSELLGVPEADRDDLRRDADLVLHLRLRPRAGRGARRRRDASRRHAAHCGSRWARQRPGRAHGEAAVVCW